MKKIFTVALVIALVAAFSVPAMAETKVKFKGEYRVRGFMLSNPSLQADQAFAKATGTPGTATRTAQINATGEGPSQSWMDMRFRLETTFQASDRLSVVTRFDALDNKKYGQNDDDWTGTAICPDRNNNIDFDRAYMVVVTDFGKFQAGRMAGGVYGNDFLDSIGERDRVRFDTKVSDWVLSFIFEKNGEADSDACTGEDILSDADDDRYYMAATYMTEDLKGGLLVGYGNYKGNSDNILYDPTGGPGVGFPPLGAPGNANGLDVTFDTSLILVDPFVDANFGDFNVKAEAQILFGKYAEFDRDCYSKGMKFLDDVRRNKVAGFGNGHDMGVQPDVDFDAYAWDIEGTWASGPFSAELGYVWVKGEDDPYDDKWESVGGIGDDWGKAFILTNTDSGFEGTLGGHAGAAAAGAAAGNLSSGSTAALNGCKMFYLGGSFSPMENLKISGLFANSKSESPGYVGNTGAIGTATAPAYSRRFASDHGSEYDLTVDWTIYDNLSYKFIAAYLDVGDYWQFGNPYRELENTWAFWQQLKLTF